MRQTIDLLTTLCAFCFLALICSASRIEKFEAADVPPPPRFTSITTVVAPGMETALEWYVPADLNVTIRADDDATEGFHVWYWPAQEHEGDTAHGLFGVTTAHGLFGVKPLHTTVYTLRARRGWTDEIEFQEQVTVTVPEPGLDTLESTRRAELRMKRQMEQLDESKRSFDEAIQQFIDSGDSYSAYDDLTNAKGQIRR